MKVITWNCNMAFRKKWHSLIHFNADIIVVQECEHPSKFKELSKIPKLNNFEWFGENQNKGIGILSFGNTKVDLDKSYNDDFRYIIPLRITNNKLSFLLYAVWAMPDKRNKRNSYVGQLWNAFNYYNLNKLEKTIVIGDWNSHVQWDHERPKGNHSLLVKKLNRHDIYSVYHKVNGIVAGDEIDPTFFLVKNREKPYHLDYCSMSEKLYSKSTVIKIGAYDNWIKLSDHMPLFISF